VLVSAWLNDALARIEADFRRSADTHLIKVSLPGTPDVDLYLKDESTHPSGSLKHRLARSLFLYGLCNGDIREGTTVIESSSGNTAVSEAYFARLLGLPFVAVVPRTTSSRKLDEIRFYGGHCHLVAPADIYAEARRLAKERGGHYMDQFTYAERATDWRGNNNIAQSIFSQMERERFPCPEWVVVSAGTGGTSATIGRYIRYQGHATRLCVADPEHSVFHDYYHGGDATLTSPLASRIEGIGRPRVEPSFIRTVVDRMVKVPDAASFATLRFLEGVLGRRCGGSTGTNVYAALGIVSRMRAEGRSGSVVSMICDAGERYLDTYYDDGWLATNGLDLTPWRERLQAFCDSGTLPQGDAG
jgi:cysteine synthase A